MAAEPSLSDVHVSYARRAWPNEDRIEFPARPWKELAEDELLADRYVETPHSGFCLELANQDSISVQIWIDLPKRWDGGSGSREDGVEQAIDDAVAAIATLATVRHPRAAADLATALADWKALARDAPEPFPHEGDVPVSTQLGPTDVVCRSLGGGRGAMTAVRQPHRRGTCPGADLRIALGPDRFALRVEGYDHVRDKGRVAKPSRPMGTNVWHVREELVRAVVAFEGHVSDYEDDVLGTVADAKPDRVRELLARHRLLFATHAALEARRTAFLDALDGLPQKARLEAFAIDEKDREKLAELGKRLSAQRGRLLEGPQFLIAASSFVLSEESTDLAKESKRLGDRTERLTAWAATLVAPTLVAGLFGANVLPGSNVSWVAFAGLALVMAGSGLGTFLWIARQRAKDRAKPTARWWGRAVGAAVVALVAGVLMIVLGTTPEEEPEVRVIERVVERNPVPVPIFGPGK